MNATTHLLGVLGLKWTGGQLPGGSGELKAMIQRDLGSRNCDLTNLGGAKAQAAPAHGREERRVERLISIHTGE
jgi:hypothetical protein